MSLTDFLKNKNIQDRFDIEFRNQFVGIHRVNFYDRRKKLKENVGFCFFSNGRNKIVMCDSEGIQKDIKTIDDFFDHIFKYRYRKNSVFWHYGTNFCFNLIIHKLPKSNQRELVSKGKTSYNSIDIKHKNNDFLFIKYNKITLKFYNLFPYYKIDLYEAVKQNLNVSIFHDRGIQNIHQINGAFITEPFLFNHPIIIAKIVKKLADILISQKKIADGFIENLPLMNIPLSNNYGLVGTAFDYLFRFKICAENPKCYTYPWIASSVLNMLNGDDKEIASDILSKAKRQYYIYLRNQIFTDKLCESALLLAKLDNIYRIGYSDIYSKVNKEDIIDLKNLIQGVQQNLFNPKINCILNPNFSLSSYLIGGADADLIIDNTLIDIKTTIKPNLSKEIMNQLMGYVALHELLKFYVNNLPKILKDDNRLDSEDFINNPLLDINLKKIGVYFARYNHLQLIDLDNIVENGKINENFLGWFELQVHRYRKPKGIKRYFKNKK